MCLLSSSSASPSGASSGGIKSMTWLIFPSGKCPQPLVPVQSTVFCGFCLMRRFCSGTWTWAGSVSAWRMRCSSRLFMTCMQSSITMEAWLGATTQPTPGCPATRTVSAVTLVSVQEQPHLQHHVRWSPEKALLTAVPLPCSCFPARLAAVRWQHRHNGGGESGGDSLRLRALLQAAQLPRGEAGPLPPAWRSRGSHGRRSCCQPGEGRSLLFTCWEWPPAACVITSHTHHSLPWYLKVLLLYLHFSEVQFLVLILQPVIKLL